MSMMPNKAIRSEYSLLGVGGLLLKSMNTEDSVSSLWERVRTREYVNTFEKFITALSLLNALGAVEIENGVLTKK